LLAANRIAFAFRPFQVRLPAVTAPMTLEKFSERFRTVCISVRACALLEQTAGAVKVATSLSLKGLPPQTSRRLPRDGRNKKKRNTGENRPREWCSRPAIYP
jgi:hypothetical protein